MQTCCGLVGELADHCGIEKWLDLDGTGEIELLSLGLGRLVPLFEDLGEGSAIYFDKLLQLVEVIGELLEALLERGELGGAPGDGIAA